MYFKQVVVEGMGCLSYVIGCPQAKIACVVDPKRDVQDYIDIANRNQLKIKHIYETHIHADHVSGNMDSSPVPGPTSICWTDHWPPIHSSRSMKAIDFILEKPGWKF